MADPSAIPWSDFRFAPVMDLPDDVVVLDLTRPDAPRPAGSSDFAIGRYDEDRRGMYEQDLFDGARTLHVGIDLGGPPGTPVKAFADGVVFAAGSNPEPGDYGHVIVTEHVLEGQTVWALYGHLSSASLDDVSPGQSIVAGQELGVLGDESENGGWPPHLHFQLSLERPQTHDLPGVVDPAEREAALRRFPDPRLVLGPLY
ncbi:MAG: peptidoglycan DD-metalloendopeptidase family protein [Deltaproteobacteria bacterium]|nr:peptidoglycan DD-metalloendopeptidase family protein [Deltaproteobacteria bacterium]